MSSFLCVSAIVLFFIGLDQPFQDQTCYNTLAVRDFSSILITHCYLQKNERQIKGTFHHLQYVYSSSYDHQNIIAMTHL